ncbi:MAG: hypothetical protein RH860_00195 [Cytophagales bacterium]
MSALKKTFIGATILALPLLGGKALAQSNDNAKTVAFNDASKAKVETVKEVPKVKVFDLRGRGVELAENSAQLNSKKGALIALVTSTNPVLAKEVIEVMELQKISGRDRVFVVLGDKQNGLDNSVALFANGKFKGLWTVDDANAEDIMTSKFFKEARKIYDSEVVPVIDAKSKPTASLD